VGRRQRAPARAPGFQALATTSSGFAWTLGRPDNHVTIDEALAHFRALAASVDVPISADFEGGLAVAPAAVAANVGRAAATGIAGLSIEDSTGDPSNPLFEFTLAVERIAAARQAIDASGTDILLTGRSEGFITGRPDLAETIRRLTAYAAAGADCLYAPGIRSIETIAAVVAAVAPRPVNVLAGRDFATVAELASAGAAHQRLRSWPAPDRWKQGHRDRGGDLHRARTRRPGRQVNARSARSGRSRATWRFGEGSIEVTQVLTVHVVMSASRSGRRAVRLPASTRDDQVPPPCVSRAVLQRERPAASATCR
jgi:hypothetical protein